jgi:hypothetical protein
MLSDPARRSLMSRPARRVCHAVRAHLSCDAVRDCALLATDSRDVMLTCQSHHSNTVRGRGHTVSAQRPLTGSDYFTRPLSRLPGSTSNIFCTCYTITLLPCANGGRMIAPYQSLLRDVPFRLYGSRRAVKVLRAALWSTVDRACSASYVELHITGEMLSFQKCEADAKDPVVRRQSRERTQHLCNPWQVFERGSTQPIASALVLRECLARRCCELFCRCGKGLPLNSSAR